jgi:hypothetical protein
MKKAIDKITIEGKDYVPLDSIDKPEYEGDIKIVVLQRGWVYIGRFERNDNDCKLHNAYNIRRWGTENGLGELANEGKKEDTILDRCHGVVEFDYLTVVCMISCREDVWQQEI